MESLKQPIFSALASPDVICENGVLMPKPVSPVIQRLKDWRARNNLSQVQAIMVFKAASLPITLDSLQNWESGRANPSALAAVALDGFLNHHQKVKPPVAGRKKRAERDQD
ncbi:MAG: helix-turn-helix transcriptional regulator [Verrucomicrobia bacterium]|nr:helix-turn-helix transcriptional regulator [Verrucomicrobiota bacterium]